MSKRLIVTALLTLCAALVSSWVPADGPGGYGARRKDAETEYQRTARDAYGIGYAQIESAERLDLDAAAATDEPTRQRVLALTRQKYREALSAFKESVHLEPDMYEAHTYIGYANRKLGQYDAALAAYAQALRLKPDYARAIEYQGEAYLGLDRFDEARFSYLRLYALDSVAAQMLLDAMAAWAEQPARSGKLSSDAVRAASQWIAARRSATEQARKTSNTAW